MVDSKRAFANVRLNPILSNQRASWSNYLDVAKGEINRLDYIVTQFLHAIRPAPPQLKLASLNEVVEKTLSLLRPELENRGLNVQVKTRRATAIVAD